MPNSNRSSKGANTRGSTATANRFVGRNRKINEPAGMRVGDRSGTDHKGIEECQDCGAYHIHGRWYRKDKAQAEDLRDQEIHQVICPGCKQIHDQNPGGVLTLKGAFLAAHFDEIMHLIQNEDFNAQGINPLEKIMEITRDEDDCLEITTTNEFLVQRLGKAVHSAYSGDIEYKFGGSDCPVRVYWQRN
jgi:hypothetical protein